MGHFYMENICTMDEQRKCELKIIAGKIGWILLIAYLGSLILMRIMPIFAENMAFYIFWAGIVWVGMKNGEGCLCWIHVILKTNMNYPYWKKVY